MGIALDLNKCLNGLTCFVSGNLESSCSEPATPACDIAINLEENGRKDNKRTSASDELNERLKDANQIKEVEVLLNNVKRCPNPLVQVLKNMILISTDFVFKFKITICRHLRVESGMCFTF